VTSTSVRRHRATGLVVLLAALVATGVGYAAVTDSAQAAAPQASETQVQQGRQLFLEGCATCHGLAAQGTGSGPGLIGVGAASVDFQVTTGRMPLAAPAVQAPRKTPQYSPEQVAALAAYVASLGAGPAIPSASDVDTTDANLAEGGELFRTNCAQCHNFAGKGGALSDGKYAPTLMNANATEMFEAMITGPQNMPNFPNATLPVEKKQAIIKYIQHLQNDAAPGGLALGSYGPVTEGVFIWTAGIGALLLAAVWIGAKVR
jgi:ubiquinol-cytochrome c reductase cytochrome c subunit